MSNGNFAHRYQSILLILIAEYLVMQISGVGLHALAENPLFSLNVDPLSWIPFLANIPNFLLLHHWLGWFTDISLFLLLLALYYNPERNRWAIVAIIVALIFFVTMMSRHIHWNFQEGFSLCYFPLLFSSFQG